MLAEHSKCNSEYKNDKLYVSLSGEIDHHAARAIREACDKELDTREPSTLEINFSGVSFMDSSGIGLILGRVAVIQNIGARLKVSGLSASQMKIFRMAGIEKIKGVELVLK